MTLLAQPVRSRRLHRAPAATLDASRPYPVRSGRMPLTLGSRRGSPPRVATDRGGEDRRAPRMTVPDGLSEAAGLPIGSPTIRRMDAHTYHARRVLLVTATAGYRHQSIPTVWRTLPQIAYGAGLTVETILEDVASLERLTPELLAEHEILCLVHTSGDLPLSDAQKQAILDYVAAGNGFVGIHGAR